MALRQRSENYSQIPLSEPLDDIELTPDGTSTSAFSSDSSTNHGYVGHPEQTPAQGIGGIVFVDELRQYFKSYKVLELLICALFHLITSSSKQLFAWIKLVPYQRPIPRFFLKNSGEYIPSLVNNESLAAHDTVNTRYLRWVGVVPILLQCLLCLIHSSRKNNDNSNNFFYRKSRSRISELHRTLCVHMTTMGITKIAVEFLKQYVGYLRPYFYQYCDPNDDYSECMAPNGGGTYCRQSFPSGHAATAFRACTLLTLYIHYRFGTRSRRRYYAQQITTRNNNNNNSNINTSKTTTQEPTTKTTTWTILELDEDDNCGMGWSRLISVLALIPIMIALWVASSRIRDNRHFPADVIAGSLLGGAIAIFSHGLWFR